MGKKITDKEKEKVVRTIFKYKDKGITYAYKHAVLATGISEPKVIDIWKEYLESHKEEATENPTLK